MRKLSHLIQPLSNSQRLPRGVWNVNQYVCTLTSCLSMQPKHTREVANARLAEDQSEPPLAEPKPFSSIPGPKGVYYFGTAFEMLRKAGQWHHLHIERFKKYGSIWKEASGQFPTLVVVANPQGVKDIAKAEGQNPVRSNLPLWEDFYKRTGRTPGIAVSSGEAWHHSRKNLDKPIMRPREVAKNVTTMQKVARDFVEKLAKQKDDVKDIKKELTKWSLESACTTLYDRRLGCLEDNPPPKTTEFIESVLRSFELTGDLMLYSPLAAKWLKRKEFNEFNKAFETVFQIGLEEINDRITNKDLLSQDSLIGYLLSQNKLTLEELHSNLTEIMIASVDTTSTAMHNILFELCKKPEIQDQVYQEISTLPANDSDLTYDHLEKLPYIMGVIKEALRLYPVAFVNTRLLDADAVINGYSVSKGTIVLVSLYAMGRNPDVYDEPEVFKPERWLRGRDGVKTDPFAFASFGLGQRSCVGRRIAILELKLLLIELLRRFRVSTTTKEHLLETRMLLVAKEPIQLTLTEKV